MHKYYSHYEAWVNGKRVAGFTSFHSKFTSLKAARKQAEAELNYMYPDKKRVKYSIRVTEGAYSVDHTYLYYKKAEDGKFYAMRK